MQESAAVVLIAEFCHGSDRWLNASQESDGTLRVAALLTALLQEPPLSLLGIEEPELNVHPGALPVLFDFLREASQRSQLVLTTHSPDLLDLLDPDDADAEEAARDLTARKIAFHRNYPLGGRPEDPVARASAVLLQVGASDESISHDHAGRARQQAQQGP